MILYDFSLFLYFFLYFYFDCIFVDFIYALKQELTCASLCYALAPDAALRWHLVGELRLRRKRKAI